MTPLSRKERQSVVGLTHPPTQRQNRTYSGSSNNTSLVSTSTNSTFNSATPCLPQPPTPSPANDAEKNLSLRQSLRRYPKAITWSILFSLTLIMEGYSTILVPNLFSLAPFRHQFGTPQRTGAPELSAAWQSALINGALAGQIIGLFVAGWLAEKIGYRRTLMAGLVATAAFITITFVAKTRAVLLVGQCLLGAPWGVFQTISTVYAGDVLPVGLRGYLTTYVNACWVIGQLIASIVLRCMLPISSEWAYRIPFGLQWVFPLPIFVVVLLAPESPWWLVRQNRFDEAKVSLRRLRKQGTVETNDTFDAGLEETLRYIKHTNDDEKAAQSGTRYVDCFKGVDRRRTEITCMCWMIQTLCGGTFMGFSTYFYEQAGLSARHAFTLSLAQFSLGLTGVLASWLLLTYLGRRTIYLSGQLLTFLCVLLIGILACIPHASTPSTKTTSGVTAIPWSIAALLLVFTAVYDATLGPVCYTLATEVPSTRLRSKTIVLARNCYNVSGIITNIITPRMLNPTAWAWGAKAGFYWAGTAALGGAWSWWRLPETGGRGFADVDRLFRAGVRAREFKGCAVVGGEGEGMITKGKRGGV